MTAQVAAMTAGQVVTALRTHYGTGWTLIEQVAAGTGYLANRHLDVVAVGLWPSRGLTIDGIEVKVSRADLKRELADPQKADEVAKFCDRFWIAAPKGVVHADMLASLVPAWGILEVEPQASRTVVRVIRPAEKTEARPVDRGFLAALLRRVPEPTEALRKSIWEEERVRADANFEARVKHEVDNRMRGLERTVERVKAFEEASGISLSSDDDVWRFLRAEHIGAAVRFIAEDRGAQWNGFSNRMASAGRQARDSARRLIEVADSLDESAQSIGGKGE